MVQAQRSMAKRGSIKTHACVVIQSSSHALKVPWPCVLLVGRAASRQTKHSSIGPGSRVVCG